MALSGARPDRAAAYRSALRSRTFRLMVTAHGVGTIGQLMLTLAVGIEVLDRTGSGGWLSVTMALGFVPYVLASGYAGMLADRHSRSAVLTWSLGVRAGCAVALAVGLPSAWPVPVLVAIAATAAFTATPAYPALAAATVHSVPDDTLPAANALLTGVVNLTWMAGPGVLGLVLMVGGGPATGMSVAAGLFVVAGLLAGRVRLAGPVRTGPIDGGWSALRAGARAVARDPAIRRPMTVAALDNFLYGFTVVAIVLLADEAGSGAWLVGPVNAALSAGGLLAVLSATVVAGRLRPATLLLLTVGTFAGSVGLLAICPWFVPTIMLAGLAGATTLLAEVTAVTMVQRATAHDFTARVFGVYDQVNVGAIAAGSLLAGPLAARIGAGTAMVLVTSGCLVAGVLMTARTRDEGHRGRHAAAPHRRGRWSARAEVSRPSPLRPMEHRPDPGGPLRRRPAVRTRP
ncbi:MFS transporter [Nakamurella sp.]|uniref:MFS transporter n=1 Tax=Nakamurella sp. TaxID=1869182 RepID=UPI003783CE8E